MIKISLNKNYVVVLKYLVYLWWCTRKGMAHGEGEICGEKLEN